jgi:hypothetical protein
VYVTKWELYDEEAESNSNSDENSTDSSISTSNANGSSVHADNKQLQCIPVQCEVASSEQVTHISVRSDELRLAVADSEGR